MLNLFVVGLLYSVSFPSAILKMVMTREDKNK